MNTDNYPSNLSDSVIAWFKTNNITPNKLHCRVCNNLMLTEDLTDVVYTGRTEQSGYAEFRRINSIKSTIDKIVYLPGTVNGTPESRWLLRGRRLNDTLFFRHTCWACYNKQLFKYEDVPRKAKKSSFYKKLLQNSTVVIPAPAASANLTFKYIFDIADDVLESERQKFDTASEASWIRRHGAKGKNLFKTYCQRQGYTASSEYFITEKGYTEAEAQAHHDNRAATLDNFINRYGKKTGTKKWKTYCNRQAYAGNKLEYFIDKFGPVVGRATYKEICKQKGVTLDNFIRKYGDIIGTQKWSDYCAKVNVGYSKIATDLFLALILKMPAKLVRECKFAEHGKEMVVNVNNKTYYIDFTYNNKAIEFFGDYWHANPDVYNADVVMPTMHKTSETIWQQDKQRIADLTSIGYKVLVIWEYEFRTNPDDTINKCLTFLDV